MWLKFPCRTSLKRSTQGVLQFIIGRCLPAAVTTGLEGTRLRSRHPTRARRCLVVGPGRPAPLQRLQELSKQTVPASSGHSASHTADLGDLRGHRARAASQRSPNARPARSRARLSVRRCSHLVVVGSSGTADLRAMVGRWASRRRRGRAVPAATTSARCRTSGRAAATTTVAAGRGRGRHASNPDENQLNPPYEYNRRFNFFFLWDGS